MTGRISAFADELEKIAVAGVKKTAAEIEAVPSAIGEFGRLLKPLTPFADDALIWGSRLFEAKTHKRRPGSKEQSTPKSSVSRP